MAHILNDTRYVRVPLDMAMPSGWMCPGCGHSYAPWVPECHHCPEPESPGPSLWDMDPGPAGTGT